MAVSFTFAVGSAEPHDVTLAVAGIRNRVKISVDGVVRLDNGGTLGIPMPNVFDLEVGVKERHIVSVRLIMQQIIDGGAKYIDVFIDGRFAFRHDW